MVKLSVLVSELATWVPLKYALIATIGNGVPFAEIDAGTREVTDDPGVGEQT